MRSRFLGLTPCIALFALAASAAAQPIHLNMLGGGIGESFTVEISGPPGADYLVVASTTTGPTPLPPPHIPYIDVGVELLTFSMSIPGFWSSLPPSGFISLTYPIAYNTNLDGKNFNFQVVRFSGNVVVEKSNLWRLTLDLPGQYANTLEPLNVARAFTTASVLPDGNVLVAGGNSGSLVSAAGLSSAELYRVNLESFELLPSMNSARTLHRATTLVDGRVLLTGGVNNTGTPIGVCEVYDPDAGVFSPVGAMSVPRVGHTATLLPDGRVLVAGGSSSFSSITAFATSSRDTTEIFDPATNTFSAGPVLSEVKTFHEAVALSDGRVLISGGITFTIILGVPVPSLSHINQVYTPDMGIGTLGGNLAMNTARAAHTAILLDDGSALLVGGATGSILSPSMLASAERFIPSTGSFVPAGSMSGARALPSLLRLPNGKIMAAGGIQGDIMNPTPVASCDAFDQGALSWSALQNLLDTRSGHGHLLLSDGTVGLFGGGGGASNVALSTAEIYQP
ncbi:MAG: kelch repeat-containing protein [Planctomycetota bacterium]